MRALFIGVQVALGWGLWVLMPDSWGARGKAMALVFLWAEPTFRERVLEVRTDAPMVVLILWATLAWGRFVDSGKKPAAWLACASLGLASALTPKAMMWILPWILAAAFRRKPERTFRLPALLVACGVLMALAAAFGFVSWWTHRTPIEIFRQAASDSRIAVGGEGIWIGADSRFYLAQSLIMGLPFWAMATWGLASWARGEAQVKGPWAHVQWTGLGAFSLSLFYSSGFPYHWMAITPFFLPAAVAGMRCLRARGGFVPVFGVGCLAALFLLAGVLPVLMGPWRSQQEAAWNCLRAYVGRDRAYVDGVNGLGRPQAAPFVTTKVVISGGADHLSARWSEERLSGMLLDEQCSLLLTDENLAWVKQNLILITPQIAVLGNTGSGHLKVEKTWNCPWPERFVFHGDPSWSWLVGGGQVRDGEGFSVVQPGNIRIQGEGEGVGAYEITVAPNSNPGTPAALDPFFLPFQRLSRGWPGY